MRMLRMAFLGAAPAGQIVFEGAAATVTPEWTVPAGVYSICSVCVGSGSSGGGGLTYRNGIAVTPGEIIEIAISGVNSGGSNVFIRRKSTSTVLCRANSANTFTGGAGQTSYGEDASFSGGNSAAHSATRGGGGAAGYAGNGGNGPAFGSSGGNGSGGGGGGGGGGFSPNRSAGGGGGVGLKGLGSNGSGGAPATDTSTNGQGGGGGSGGASGAAGIGTGSTGGGGGNYGGGSPGGASPGFGAVRIIWGTGRNYPSNAGDV